MSSSLEQLKATGTVVVCDSGKLDIIDYYWNFLLTVFLQVTSPVCIEQNLFHREQKY